MSIEVTRGEKVRGKAGTSIRARASKSKQGITDRSRQGKIKAGERERETERKGSQIFQIFGVEKSSAFRTKFYYHVTNIQYSSTKLIRDLRVQYLYSRKTRQFRLQFPDLKRFYPTYISFRCKL